MKHINKDVSKKMTYFCRHCGDIFFCVELAKIHGARCEHNPENKNGKPLIKDSKA